MLAELLAETSRYTTAALESSTQLMGIVAVIVAGAFVIVSSFVKTMIPLRWLAIGSNVGFVAYGALHPSYPMLLLHAVLLPINFYRLAEMVQLTRRVRAVSAESERSGVWLKPYMRSARLRPGTVLFRKGDLADRLYLLAAGRIELVEIGVPIKPGEIFGEIAFFAPDRARGFTARCTERSIVLSIDESTVKQLYFQNPAFGLKMIELVASRLSADRNRLTEQLTALRAQLAARAEVSD